MNLGSILSLKYPSLKRNLKLHNINNLKKRDSLQIFHNYHLVFKIKNFKMNKRREIYFKYRNLQTVKT